MKLMRQVLARLAPCRASAMLWSAGCVAVLLTACATHTEPLIHRVQVEVTREVPVNATRVAATEVEVTSQAPVEVIQGKSPSRSSGKSPLKSLGLFQGKSK